MSKDRNFQKLAALCRRADKYDFDIAARLTRDPKSGARKSLSLPTTKPETLLVGPKTRFNFTHQKLAVFFHRENIDLGKRSLEARCDDSVTARLKPSRRRFFRLPPAPEPKRLRIETTTWWRFVRDLIAR